jgi:hypothetical protein
MSMPKELPAYDVVEPVNEDIEPLTPQIDIISGRDMTNNIHKLTLLFRLEELIV